MHRPESANVINCLYHGWTYVLDGRLHGAPEFEALPTGIARLRLPEFHADTWGPYAFVYQYPAAIAHRSHGRDPARSRALGCPLDRLTARFPPGLRDRVQLEGIRG